MSATTIDLTQFCCEESSRYSLRAPFVRNGIRWATDGRILVGIPAPGEPNSEGRLPDCESVLSLSPADGDWVPWPDVGPCDLCNGTGEILTPCTSCDGDGSSYCSQCRDHHPCQCCDSEGQIDDICKCRFDPDLSVKRGKLTVSLYYAAKISTLPSVEYIPGKSNKKPIHFRFGEGGIGMVAGIEKPKD